MSIAISNALIVYVTIENTSNLLLLQRRGQCDHQMWFYNDGEYILVQFSFTKKRNEKEYSNWGVVSNEVGVG